MPANGDLVTRQIARRTHQRVGIAEGAIPPPQHDDDVAATGEGRQLTGIDRTQGELFDQRRHLLDLLHLDMERFCMIHANTSWIGGTSPGVSASTITPMYAPNRHE